MDSSQDDLSRADAERVLNYLRLVSARLELVHPGLLARAALAHAHEACFAFPTAWSYWDRVLTVAGHHAVAIDGYLREADLPGPRLDPALAGRCRHAVSIAGDRGFGAAGILKGLEVVAPEEAREALVARIIELRARVQELVDHQAGERDVDWLSLSPPKLLDRSVATIGLYGRTSAGKTTLVRRLLGHLAPEWSRLAAHMATDPAAHTTKVPVILEFHPMASSWWNAAGPDGRHGGAIDVTSGALGNEEALTRVLRTSTPDEYAWCQLTLSSRAGVPVRFVDMPGTHGDSAGAWGTAARVMARRLDAYVLPMDHRDFRSEELRDLVTALTAHPRRPIALAMRLAPGDPYALRRRYLSERIWPALEAHDERLARILCTPELRRRVNDLAFFFVGREPGRPDDQLSELAQWALQLAEEVGRSRPAGTTPGPADAATRELLSVLRAYWSTVREREDAERILEG